MRILTLIFAICAGFPLFAHGDGGACPAKTQIVQLRKNFEFLEWDTSSKNWREASTDCTDGTLEAKIYRALLLLKNLPELTPLTGTWAANIVGNRPYRFLTDRVRQIRIDDQVTSRCGVDNSSILAVASDSSSNTVTVCQFSVTGPDVELMTTLIHEARHLQSDAEKAKNAPGTAPETHGHAFCKRGPLASLFACDENYGDGDGGAYSAGLEFLLRLARTHGVDKILREEAQSMSRGYAEAHFNLFPGGTHIGLLLQDDKGTVNFFDNSTRKLIPIAEGLTPSTIFTLRFRPTFFNNDTGDVVTFVRHGEFANTEGSFAKTFRDVYTPEQRKSLLDVYYGQNYACLLFKTSLRCEWGENDAVTVEIPAEVVPVQFAAMNEAMNGSDLVHIVTANGDLYMLPLEKNITKWSWDKLTVTPSFRNYLGVAILPGMKRIAIESNGRLVEVLDERRLEPVLELKDYRYKKMQAPYYWTPAVEEL